jgi:hypothetical protein
VIANRKQRSVTGLRASEQSITIRDPDTVNRQLEAVSAEVQATDETVREMERFMDFQEEIGKPLPHGTRVR